MIKQMLEKRKDGTGGLLFIFTSMILAVILIGTTTFIRAATSRSVAESVEHTIAMQCLASCYTHPEQYGDYQVWTSNTTFEPINRDGVRFDPLNTFNSVMKSYRLMRSNERPNAADGASGERISMKWNRNDHVYDGETHPTFEIQIGPYACYDSWWDHIFKITPNPVRVVVEDSYSLR